MLSHLLRFNFQSTRPSSCQWQYNKATEPDSMSFKFRKRFLRHMTKKHLKIKQSRIKRSVHQEMLLMLMEMRLMLVLMKRGKELMQFEAQ